MMHRNPNRAYAPCCENTSSGKDTSAHLEDNNHCQGANEIGAPCTNTDVCHEHLLPWIKLYTVHLPRQLCVWHHVYTLRINIHGI